MTPRDDVRDHREPFSNAERELHRRGAMVAALRRLLRRAEAGDVRALVLAVELDDGEARAYVSGPRLARGHALAMAVLRSHALG